MKTLTPTVKSGKKKIHAVSNVCLQLNTYNAHFSSGFGLSFTVADENIA